MFPLIVSEQSLSSSTTRQQIVHSYRPGDGDGDQVQVSSSNERLTGYSARLPRAPPVFIFANCLRDFGCTRRGWRHNKLLRILRQCPHESNLMGWSWRANFLLLVRFANFTKKEKKDCYKRITKPIRCNISPHILVATNYTVRPRCLFNPCAVTMINDKLVRNILLRRCMLLACVCPSVTNISQLLTAA